MTRARRPSGINPTITIENFYILHIKRYKQICTLNEYGNKTMGQLDKLKRRTGLWKLNWLCRQSCAVFQKRHVSFTCIGLISIRQNVCFKQSITLLAKTSKWLRKPIGWKRLNQSITRPEVILIKSGKEMEKVIYDQWNWNCVGKQSKQISSPTIGKGFFVYR